MSTVNIRNSLQRVAFQFRARFARATGPEDRCQDRAECGRSPVVSPSLRFAAAFNPADSTMFTNVAARRYSGVAAEHGMNLTPSKRLAAIASIAVASRRSARCRTWSTTSSARGMRRSASLLRMLPLTESIGPPSRRQCAGKGVMEGQPPRRDHIVHRRRKSRRLSACPWRRPAVARIHAPAVPAPEHRMAGSRDTVPEDVNLPGKCWTPTSRPRVVKGTKWGLPATEIMPSWLTLIPSISTALQAKFGNATECGRSSPTTWLVVPCSRRLAVRERHSPNWGLGSWTFRNTRSRRKSPRIWRKDI